MSAKAKSVRSVDELLAHALAIETEAAERYAELADQMSVHNNPEVAALFRRMAQIEGRHVGHIEALAAGRTLPHIAAWDYRWQGGESPEAIGPDEMHYLIAPHEALEAALAHERKAVGFYGELARQARDAEVRKLARELAEEEREHVGWLEQWLARYPQPQDRPDDPDPPNEAE